MVLAFLSTRLRTWLLFAVLVPVAGRLLRAVGVRLEGRSPRAGRALTSAGELARRRKR